MVIFLRAIPKFMVVACTRGATRNFFGAEVSCKKDALKTAFQIAFQPVDEQNLGIFSKIRQLYFNF